ncbi:MAG: hypothetical protein C0523_08910 [Cytophaga sp.]|nr:hypothetical protein [Cytophaga sp.]
MPKIKCYCGEVISLSEIPSLNQLLLISDVEFDKFRGKVDVEELFEKMKLVVYCNSCKRLHVYYNGFDEEATIYKIDK